MPTGFTGDRLGQQGRKSRPGRPTAWIGRRGACARSRRCSGSGRTADVLPTVAPTPPAGTAAPTARSPFLLILLASGAVALMLGEPVDAAVISGVVAVNAVIG